MTETKAQRLARLKAEVYSLEREIKRISK